jgi:purine-binding chemotaxis protein CheW
MFDERTRLILEERARNLARPIEKEDDGDTLSLVVVGVGSERYGLDITRLQETRALSGLTHLPNVPPFWRGLVNLRGHLVPVLDLRRYLQLPDGTAAEEGIVVVVSGRDLAVGLLVDAVTDVRRMQLGQIKPPPAETAGTRSQVVQGVTPDLISVLDLDALLADPALSVQAEMI